MANSSRVPAVIAYLVDYLGGVLSVPVFDGPALGDDARKAWLEVGTDDPEFQGGSSLVSAQSRMEWAGLGARSRDEHVTIHCAAWAWTGDDTLTAPRAVAYAIVAEAEAALVADPSMGGIALYGDVSDLILRQGLTADGALAAVLFQVHCKARLSA